MTDEKTTPPSKISYYKEIDCANPFKHETISLSVESQTNEGAIDLFRKLKEDAKI